MRPASFTLLMLAHTPLQVGSETDIEPAFGVLQDINKVLRSTHQN